MLVNKGEKVVKDVYGYQHIEAKIPLSENTIFRLASMTKPITSVALLMLYEEGRFQLNDPIAKYLPELANLKLYDGDDANGDLTGPMTISTTAWSSSWLASSSS